MVHIIWFSTLDYTIDSSEHFIGYIVHDQEIGFSLRFLAAPKFPFRSVYPVNIV